ncbi:hypothetical protein [Halobacteriovorax sp. CON-3]|uniref:hypothetical protein n=1 Tax=Halobacteriovorax sp. CON-3 TaxID=3157710 RepID=UPI0037180275
MVDDAKGFRNYGCKIKNNLVEEMEPYHLWAILDLVAEKKWAQQNIKNIKQAILNLKIATLDYETRTAYETAELSKQSEVIRIMTKK